MGMDLHRRKSDRYEGEEYFRANMRGWGFLTDLAEEGGWKPKGTIYLLSDGTEDPVWDGGYHSNDGQYVTPEDARAMADAIERARYGKPHQDFISEFVAYCRGGGFKIL